MENTELIKQETASLPPWLRAMRQAAMQAVSTDDVEDMVRAQVEKAKKGDQAALRFVFDKVLGGDQMRGATITQNNFYGGAEPPDEATAARPGTNAKVRKMQQRLAAGKPLFNRDDGPEIDLT